MKKDTFRTEWHPITEEEALEITNCTDNPGYVYEYPTDKIPPSLKVMPGITGTYVSGCPDPFALENGNLVIGEFVITREESGIGKGYNFLLAQTTDGVYVYNGPYKYFDNHHYSTEYPIPVQSLFGNIPYTKSE
ncbi:MAG: hypothetical protein KAW47_11255 [Thermoplasmatales archaeon]|nr:hypothetical protein [Thermoplasmatales archaeon]